MCQDFLWSTLSWFSLFLKQGLAWFSLAWFSLAWFQELSLMFS